MSRMEANQPSQLLCSYCGDRLCATKISMYCSKRHNICLPCFGTSGLKCRICHPTAFSQSPNNSDEEHKSSGNRDLLDEIPCETSASEMDARKGPKNEKKNYFKPVQAEGERDKINIPARLIPEARTRELMPELEEVVEELSGSDPDREGTAGVKECLQLYHQADDDLEQYRSELGSSISQQDAAELRLRQTEMEEKFIRLRDEVGYSIQRQKDFMSKEYLPFKDRVDATFQKHAAEHQKLREETGALTEYINQNAHKQNIINEKMINRLIKGELKVRGRVDPQPAISDCKETPPATHTPMTALNAGITLTSCLNLLLKVVFLIMLILVTFLLFIIIAGNF